MTDIPTGQCAHGHVIHYRYPCPDCVAEETGIRFDKEFRVITRNDLGRASQHGQTYSSEREARDHMRALKHKVFGTAYPMEIESRLVTKWETHSV